MPGYRDLGDVLPVRLKPFLDPDNTAFWTGGKDGRLLIHRCLNCGLWIHPSAPRCRRCHSAEVVPEPVTGRARVVTYTVNYQPWIPGSEPYIIAVVELIEQDGLHLTTNLVGIDGDDVEMGMEVEVVFEPVGEIFLPLFQPAGLRQREQ